MKNERFVIFSLLLIGLSVVLQTVPPAVSRQLIFLTVLSSLSIFILTGLSLFLGFAAYIIVGIGTAVVNPFDAVLFWGITGVLGLSGGLWYHFTKNKIISAAITACIIAITALTINQLLALYPSNTAYSLTAQFMMLLGVLFPCCLAFIYFAVFIDRQFNSLIDLRPGE